MQVYVLIEETKLAHSVLKREKIHSIYRNYDLAKKRAKELANQPTKKNVKHYFTVRIEETVD